MHLETYTITLIIGLLGSSTVGGFLTWLLMRPKIKAETLFYTAQAESTTMNEFRQQIAFLQGQVRAITDSERSNKILIETYQKNEREYVEREAGYKRREAQYLKKEKDYIRKQNELTDRVAQMEETLQTLQSQQNANTI